MGLLDVLGSRARAQRGGFGGGGMSPVAMALVGLFAYRTLKGKGRLSDMLGMNHPAGGTAPTGNAGTVGNPPASGGLGGLAGMGGLGGMLNGGAVASGLRELIDRFRQTGHEQKAQSWVSKGSNEPVEPHELEQALGEERIQWLVEQTGMPREELLAKLSGELPKAVDELTPEGRVPTDDEVAQQVNAPH